ncbi:MAG: dockerin type I repeat-containing protein [Oscillospiraceae bacterium]|nr:dockerin type I repeat-containing protein [Oscillospiraceae bacterium]
MKKFLIAAMALCLLLTATVGVLAVSAEEKTLYGDVNGDGKVNNRDLGLLQQYVNGFDVDVDVEAADVTHDDKVNNRDLGLLQQYVNGFDVDLEPEQPEEDDNIFNDTELDWT